MMASFRVYPGARWPIREINCFYSDHQLRLPRTAPMDLALGPLRTLETIARHGSFSRAARELNLTQPAVSMQVAQLERRLGLPLLERVGKRAFPTAAGEVLLAHAARAFRELQAGGVQKPPPPRGRGRPVGPGP